MQDFEKGKKKEGEREIIMIGLVAGCIGHERNSNQLTQWPFRLHLGLCKQHTRNVREAGRSDCCCCSYSIVIVVGFQPLPTDRPTGERDETRAMGYNSLLLFNAFNITGSR